MKFYFLLTFLFLFTACVNSPVFYTQKENNIQNKIQHNKDDAVKAQEAYLKLQMQRKAD